MLTFIDHIAFRLARRQARIEAIKNGVILLGLLLALGIVGTLDYQDELRQQAEAAEARYATQQAAMLACLNGGSPGPYRMTAEGHRAYLVCEIHEVTDENVREKRS